MPILREYQQFDGRHWETGSIHNVLAYQGVTLTHTGGPPSEALLMGIAGGAVMGYFHFHYEGHDPQIQILTRNTFDPWTTVLSRLGVVQDVRQTASPKRAAENLIDILESGVPAIVWADIFTLPYNAMPQGDQMWGMAPIVVYGYDSERDRVEIADRSAVPLVVDTATLAAARGRVKKDKHRAIALSPPERAKLRSAVHHGIWDTIKLYLEKPPKGSKNNFGLAAYRHWAKLLQAKKGRGSWATTLPAGQTMYLGLLSAYSDLYGFGPRGDAERNLYADFLLEAAQILERPALTEVADRFRAAAGAWEALNDALLPASLAPLADARALIDRRGALFTMQGGAALDAIREINQQLAAMRAAMATDFPLDGPAAATMRAEIADRVMAIHDIEADAVAALRAVMAES